MVPDARRIERISFEEMLELAGRARGSCTCGPSSSAPSTICRSRAVDFQSGRGTLICREEEHVEAPVVAGSHSTEMKPTHGDGAARYARVAVGMLKPVSDAAIEVT